MASADNDEQIIAWLSWYNLRTYIRAKQVQSILQTSFFLGASNAKILAFDRAHKEIIQISIYEFVPIYDRQT